jgi:hypothetical protein
VARRNARAGKPERHLPIVQLFYDRSLPLLVTGPSSPRAADSRQAPAYGRIFSPSQGEVNSALHFFRHRRCSHSLGAQWDRHCCISGSQHFRACPAEKDPLVSFVVIWTRIGSRTFPNLSIPWFSRGIGPVVLSRRQAKDMHNEHSERELAVFGSAC